MSADQLHRIDGPDTGPHTTLREQPGPTVERFTWSDVTLPDDDEPAPAALERAEQIGMDDAGRRHILDGDDHGGGHRNGQAIPGKTEFPAWDDDTTCRLILDVAINPDGGKRQWNGNEKVHGEREGVIITVIIEPGGRIATAWPNPGEGITRNPRTSDNPPAERDEQP